MKKIVFVFITLVFLVSCGRSEEKVEVTPEKRDFIVQVKKFSDFTQDTFLEKTGKIASSQDIRVSSQASGRVASLFIKEGESVRKGEVVARLDDSILNYGLNLEKSKNNLEKSQISYDTTKLNLDKQISDLKINLEDLKIDISSSKSSLELEKIENNLTKLALDYDNLKISNEQTIEGFYRSLESSFSTFRTLIDDVIEFSDTQLGVTTKNETANDGFENYLGIKNTAQKKETEALLRQLISFRDVNSIQNDISIETLSDIDTYTEIIAEGYAKIDNVLSSLQIIFDNSVSTTTFTESDISTSKTTINGYQTSLTSYNSSFVTLKNSIRSFLDTYLNNEALLVKQIELSESDKKIFTKGLDIQVELQENALTEAIASRELTLKSMQAAIVDAEIAYNQSLKEYNKLTITSPISGVIGEVSIDVGQEVSNGTLLFTVTNNILNEATISFNKKELDFVSEGDKVGLTFEGDTFTGTLYSLSKNADSNLKYASRVIFQEDIDLIGNIISIQVPITLNYPLIPLNVVKINNAGVGTIQVLVDNVIEQKNILLGDIYGDMVEMREILDPNENIIMNYVDNFDPEKFEMRVEDLTL